MKPFKMALVSGVSIGLCIWLLFSPLNNNPLSEALAIMSILLNGFCFVGIVFYKPIMWLVDKLD